MTETPDPTAADAAEDGGETATTEFPTAAETAARIGAGAPAKPRTGLWSGLLTGTAAVLVVLIGLLAWQTWDYLSTRAGIDARETVVETTHTQVKRMFGYDYQTIEEDLPTVLEGLTPGFAEEYQAQREDIVEQVREQQATVRVTRLDVAPMTVSGDRAEVLVFLKQVSNTNEQVDAVTTRSRALVSLERDGDRWLISGVEPV